MVSTLTAVVFSVSCLLEYCPTGSAFPTELKYAEHSDPKDWDFLLFSQQWPPTACAEWKEVNSSHKCNNPENEASWTIHGIWYVNQIAVKPVEVGHFLIPQNVANRTDFTVKEHLEQPASVCKYSRTLQNSFINCEEGPTVQQTAIIFHNTPQEMPTTGNGHNMGPAFCNNSWHFDVKQLQDIMPLLHRYWPNLYSGTPKANLWSHEWIKHGTCAASLPSLGDQLKYFTAGLNLAQEYNLYSVLSASNITPSDSVHYQIKDIEQAIVKGLGVTPFLSCDLAKKDKSLYLQEVRLCLDKQLQLQNCSTNSTVGLQQAEKCPSNAEVAYLPMGNMEPEKRTDPLKILAVINALIGLTL